MTSNACNCLQLYFLFSPSTMHTAVLRRLGGELYISGEEDRFCAACAQEMPPNSKRFRFINILNQISFYKEVIACLYSIYLVLFIFRKLIFFYNKICFFKIFIVNEFLAKRLIFSCFCFKLYSLYYKKKFRLCAMCMYQCPNSKSK